MLRRRPSSVVRRAVGWWAKSSYTAMPRTIPRNSMRRRTFWNRASAAAATAGATPMVCRSDGRQGVELVVGSREAPFHCTTDAVAVLQDIKGARFALGREIAHGRAKAAHATPATLVQHAPGFPPGH